MKLTAFPAYGINFYYAQNQRTHKPAVSQDKFINNTNTTRKKVSFGSFNKLKKLKDKFFNIFTNTARKKEEELQNIQSIGYKYLRDNFGSFPMDRDYTITPDIKIKKFIDSGAEVSYDTPENNTKKFNVAYAANTMVLVEDGNHDINTYKKVLENIGKHLNKKGTK